MMMNETEVRALLAERIAKLKEYIEKQVGGTWIMQTQSEVEILQKVLKER